MRFFWGGHFEFFFFRKRKKNASSNEKKQPIHMRYHFFVHHELFLQNLGKEAVRTNMHTTVRQRWLNCWGNKYVSYQSFFQAHRIWKGLFWVIKTNQLVQRWYFFRRFFLLTGRSQQQLDFSNQESQIHQMLIKKSFANQKLAWISNLQNDNLEICMLKKPQGFT